MGPGCGMVKNKQSQAKNYDANLKAIKLFIAE